MRILLLFLLTIYGGLAIGADVNQYIADTTQLFPNGIGPELKPFIGSFKIEPALSPDKISKVNYEIEIINDHKYYLDQDWELKLDFGENGSRIIGDTLFAWPGPHKKGDKFTGSFELQPLKSGTWNIGLYLYRLNQDRCYLSPISGISFSYCFDEDGLLQYCGEYKPLAIHCESSKVSFFDKNKDTLFIQGINQPHLDRGFSYNYYISPPPKINDTSSIHFILRANADSDGGVDIHLSTKGIKILSYPDPIGYSIHKGDIIELEFSFKPIPREYNDLGIYFSGWNAASNSPNTKTIMIQFVFNNDNSLKYIGYTGTIAKPAGKSLNSFPKIDDKKDCSLVLITKKGDILTDQSKIAKYNRHK